MKIKIVYVFYLVISILLFILVMENRYSYFMDMGFRRINNITGEMCFATNPDLKLWKCWPIKKAE